MRLTSRDRKMLIYKHIKHLKARSSGGERFPDTEEVGGSKPLVPTIKIKGLAIYG